MNHSELTKEAILAAYQFRHATKDFDPNKKISDEDFKFILETGRLSPSSYGFEPWKFVVVQNQELRTKLAEYATGARRQLPTASHFVVILARLPHDMKANSEYIQYMMNEVQQLTPEILKMKEATYDAFLKTNFAIEDDPRVMFEWACRQTYIALGNMLTAAAMIGIDSCPIEGFNRKEVNELLIKEGVLDPEHYAVSVMAAFGYRANEPHAKTRQTTEQVVTWID